MPTIEAATRRFRRAIERAKSEGVDVDEYFVEMKEKVALAYVRCVGLSMSIAAVFYAPKYILDLRIQCLREHLDVKIPEDMVYWACLVGFLSILAFGFDLVDPRTLFKASSKNQDDDADQYDGRKSDRFKTYQIKREDLFKPLEQDDTDDEGTDGAV